MRRPRGRPTALLLVACACGLTLAFLSGALDPLVARFTGAGQGADVTDPSDGGSRGPDPRVAAATDDRPAWMDGSPTATIEGPNPNDQNDRAVAALESGDLDGAIALLEEAVTARPDDVTFAANLGEAYLRRARQASPDDPAAALEDFDRALEWTRDGDRRSRIAALRDRAKVIAETEAEFVVRSTPHFTFKFDSSRAEVLEGIEDLKVLLEDTYQEYGELFQRRPVEAGEKKIEVVLYRAEGFDAVTGLGDWAGGVFDGTIRVPVADLRDKRRVARVRNVLRHETAHAFTHSIGGARVPAWLNEGVAQRLEDPANTAERVRFARARLAAGGADLISLGDLTGSLIGWKERAKITRAYDQALAFTDYLVEQYGIDLVFEMVAACAADGAKGAGEHFRARILVDLDVVLNDFAAGLAD